MTRPYHRDIGREIQAALADPVLKRAMRRAMAALLEKRAAALPSPERLEELREQATAIKDEALERHEELLTQFQRAAEAAGATVVRARDGEEARAYIRKLACERSVELVVKSKSMTSEEIRLGPALEETGCEVVEGDLGERIIQLAGERPSHLVAPAIHKSKDEIIRLLSEKMGIADPPGDAEGLTRLVRADLRGRFLSAGMGITGANFAIAETGSIALVENEGNASLTTVLPPVHVALMGREKLIPRLADLAVFMELLPANATGQKMTSYLSLVTGRQRSPLLPDKAGLRREFHLVILDNGRTRALADRELRESLRCIRCGACLNICAPYTAVGGHVYGADPYPGGIGCAWTYITQSHSQARDFNGLCTTCSRCTEVCPVRIDIPWLNTIIKERCNREFGTEIRQRAFARTDLLGKAMSLSAPLGNAAMSTRPVMAILSAMEIDPSRTMPAYHRPTFRAWFERREAARAPGAGASARAPAGRPAPGAGALSRRLAPRPGAPAERPSNTARVALFVDCFTNYNVPQAGAAAVRVLERAGVEVVLAHNSCCGRASMSQGMLGRPRRWAMKNIAELIALIDKGYEIVVVEPSCLSSLRDDYTRLLENAGVDVAALRRLQQHCHDVTEYLVERSHAGCLELAFKPLHEAFVVHGHCHHKSLGLESYPAELLRLVPGIELREVEALCCGMVGSFGYKKEYSDLSRAIGTRLFKQIQRHAGDVVACGISCRSQIQTGTGRRVYHPVEILAKALP